MIKIESIEDERRGVVTYCLSDGRHFRLQRDDVARHGLAKMARMSGIAHLLPTEPVPVMQEGRIIGTVPADFDPLAIKSKSFLYDPRPGDFIREKDHWIASRTLGPGDLEEVPGFKFGG